MRSLTLSVVGSATGGVYQSTSDSGDEQSVRDPELDSVVNGLFLLFQHGIELGSLGNGSWETIENETKSGQ